VRIVFGVVMAAALLSGCSIKHDVVKDYPQYLAGNQGEARLPSTRAASTWAMTPATQAHRYEFRSAMAGAANVWVVEFGKMLDDTLRSADVQNAFGSLVRADGAAGTGGKLVFDLQSYTYAELGAHVVLKVGYERDGTEVFNKVYMADGTTQGGKMFWGGAFAMKNAVQQSSKLALDTILRQLIDDLNARDGGR